LFKSTESNLEPADNVVADIKTFNTNLQSLSKLLSHEVTKFAIAHSSPPFPEAETSATLAGGVCNSASQLVGCFLLLPATAGSTFLQLISSELEALILSLKQFTTTIQNIVLNK
jgi:hypothetical protein